MANIFVLLLLLAVLTTLNLNADGKHLHGSDEKAEEKSCSSPEEVYLKAHVRVPGCYPKGK